MEVSSHDASSASGNPEALNGSMQSYPAQEPNHSALINCTYVSPSPEDAELSVEEWSPPSDEVKGGRKRKRGDSEDLGGIEPGSCRHPLWKTTLCSYFRSQSRSCNHADSCRYAHGEEELRIRPDDTWDPTSEQAKKAFKSAHGDKLENSVSNEDGVLMTDVIADPCLDPLLSKCIVNLPKFWCSEKLRSLLNDQGILFSSAKKKKGMSIGFVNFENTEHVKSGTEGLSGKFVGSKCLKVADVIPRAIDNQAKFLVQSSSQAEEKEVTDNVNPSLATNGSDSAIKTARNVVTPLADMPYSSQLQHKKNLIVQILKRLTRNARKACPTGVPLPQWVLNSREIGGLPCNLEGIVESPLVNGYRNKCEFSVGNSIEGKSTVGFMLGNFREGVTAVQEPVDCPNVSRIACSYALIFQDFLRTSSLPIWNRFDNTGFWRQLTVREGSSPRKDAVEASKSGTNISEVMLIVQVCSTGLDDEVISCELERLAQTFTRVALTNSPSLPLTALVIQDHIGISNAAPADASIRILPIPAVDNSFELKTADDVPVGRIHDYINSLRFSISPTSFFQVNTLAAEKLYSLAGDWANLSQDTLLFDVCCGTGTIGLALAHRVGMVIGIEMNASAVSDACKNAEINYIKNCRFVCGKAEDVVGQLLREYLDQIPNSANESEENSRDKNVISENKKDPEDASISVPQFKNVVAIVDPPRAGLHPTVIKVLRTHERLRRIVYVSCNPETLVANAIELCTPSAMHKKVIKNNGGWRNMSSAGLARHRAKSMPLSEPFYPVKAMAVDLFPHTPHCELVMLLER